jgi:hypothetical protein
LGEQAFLTSRTVAKPANSSHAHGLRQRPQAFALLICRYYEPWLGYSPGLLLSAQWGRLYTSVGDITGEASGCSDAETIVWVGTENRHHVLGHISMLGTHGDPVLPMSSGGFDEAHFGDPEWRALTEWARECRAKDGVVIRPHFPAPSCEEPAYMMLGQLDGTELARFADPACGPLEVFQFSE